MAKNNANLMALRLTVNNHPGVMTHVCGLFARRAFNVEGIVCTPQPGPDGGGGTSSRIWLVVQRDERLEQMIRQVRKLYDVLEVLAFEADESALSRMDACMAGWEAAGPCAESAA
jgi:acetolactate synthase-1/3 small subunit